MILKLNRNYLPVLVGFFLFNLPFALYYKKELIKPFLKLDKREIIEAKKIYELEFPLSPVMATIKKGHHLLLRISTQSNSEDCQGNLGVYPCFPTENQLNDLSEGEFTLHLNENIKSGITLPIISKNSLIPSRKNYNFTPNHPF